MDDIIGTSEVLRSVYVCRIVEQIQVTIDAVDGKCREEA